MKINKPLWKRVSLETCNQDLTMQTFQKTLLRAIIQAVRQLDSILKTQVTCEIVLMAQITESVIHSVSFISQANRDIN